MSKSTIAVLFGGKSTEHEVSIITGLQVMQNLDKTKYDVLPIYINKSGRWILGDGSFLLPGTYRDLATLEEKYPQTNLLESESFKKFGHSIKRPLPKIDVVIPAFHGAYGEDGKIQGLLETSNIPDVGCDTLASSIGMHQLIQKQLFSAANIPQVKFNKNGAGLKFPLFVKPSNGGSSIGITKVHTPKELADAIEVAKMYDKRVIVEESAEGFMEINISILGNSGGELETSVCEQPVPSKEVLTFSDKYQSNSNKNKGMASAKRLIPAPIKKSTADKISEYAKIAFESIDGSGFARIDFLVSPDEKTIYINEINTLPGSFAFYLWEKSGLPFSALLDRLIELAKQRFQEKASLTHTFSNNLLATFSEGLKGGKLKN